MKNYDEMSDLVIDRKVFVAIYGECIGDKDMHRVWQDNKFRPCSNPSNAWPIIFDRKIAIGWFCGDKWRAEGDNQFMAGAYKQTTAIDENPLRAAMICFLKMKDAENAA